ncbi:MAG: glycosyltransferase family 4 protein [Pyrinomonadaceae bacterium]
MLGSATNGTTRITLVIEALTSGGAQRQMIYLAQYLCEQGYKVQIVTYHLVAYDNREHFLPTLERLEIPVISIKSVGKWQRYWELRRAIKATRPQLVISFLYLPNLLCELARLPHSEFRLVVSERTGCVGDVRRKDRVRFQMHRLADAVVFNSNSLREFVIGHAPWLAGRDHVITNCVDLDSFRPAGTPPSGEPSATGEESALRVVVAARVRPEKNALTLLEALAILRRTAPSLRVVVDWYGNDFFSNGEATERSGHFLELRDEIGRRGMEDCFRLHRPVSNLLPVYQSATVACLPSIYESFPNAICEAMACGLPVIASRISDNPRLVVEGRNGYLFDPSSPDEVAGALLRFAELPDDERRRMAAASRQLAESLLQPKEFGKKWVTLIDSLTPGNRPTRRLGRRQPLVRNPERLGGDI